MRAPHELVGVYVWQIPVRIAHWLIALSIFALSATGIYMGRPFMTVPGPAGDSFVVGWVKVIHGYVAYVFIAFVMLFVIMGAIFERFGAGSFFIDFPVARRKAQIARDEKVPAPLTQLVADLCTLAHKELGEEADHVETVQVIEKWAEAQIR